MPPILKRESVLIDKGTVTLHVLVVDSETGAWLGRHTRQFQFGGGVPWSTARELAKQRVAEWWQAWQALYQDRAAAELDIDKMIDEINTGA